MIERVLRLGNEKSLTGILTEPAGASKTAFVFLNAGLVHRVGPNRIYVRLARALADRGFLAVRFDLSGLGDSEPRQDGLPYHESRFVETREVLDFIEKKKGIERFVMVGLCSGADHAFRAALADERTAGAVLLDGYTYRTAKFHLHRYLKRIHRWESWRVFFADKVIRRGLDRLRGGARAPQGEQLGFVMDVPPREVAEDHLRELLSRGLRFLFVYTYAVDKTYNHAGQFYEMFPSLRPSSSIRVEFWPDADHVFTVIEHQERLIRTVTDWAEAHFSARAEQKQAIPAGVQRFLDDGPSSTGSSTAT